MRITKFGHACVRIDHDGGRLVIDPGSFTARDAVEGADVVLITHEHADHYDADHLRATTAQIHTIEAVAAVIREEAPDLADRLHVVSPGDELDLGLPVRVVGEKHAVIHPDYPRFDNSGYLLTVGDQLVYHPGDALTPPGEAIDLLLAPVSAPWLKVGEAVDFVRDVGAAAQPRHPRQGLQRRRPRHGRLPHGQPRDEAARAAVRAARRRCRPGVAAGRPDAGLTSSHGSRPHRPQRLRRPCRGHRHRRAAALGPRLPRRAQRRRLVGAGRGGQRGRPGGRRRLRAPDEAGLRRRSRTGRGPLGARRSRRRCRAPAVACSGCRRPRRRWPRSTAPSPAGWRRPASSPSR